MLTLNFSSKIPTLVLQIIRYDRQDQHQGICLRGEG